MKTLIVINNLGCGGAQKSLISLLNELTMQQMEIDLLVLNQKDVFLTRFQHGSIRLVRLLKFLRCTVPLGKALRQLAPKRFVLKCCWQSACIKSARILNTIRYRIFGMFGNGLFRCKAKNTT